jgi:hypothetical protein
MQLSTHPAASAICTAMLKAFTDFDDMVQYVRDAALGRANTLTLQGAYVAAKHRAGVPS